MAWGPAISSFPHFLPQAGRRTIGPTIALDGTEGERYGGTARRASHLEQGLHWPVHRSRGWRDRHRDSLLHDPAGLVGASRGPAAAGRCGVVLRGPVERLPPAL